MIREAIAWDINRKNRVNTKQLFFSPLKMQSCFHLQDKGTIAVFLVVQLTFPRPISWVSGWGRYSPHHCVALKSHPGVAQVLGEWEHSSHEWTKCLRDRAERRALALQRRSRHFCQPSFYPGGPRIVQKEQVQRYFLFCEMWGCED